MIFKFKILNFKNKNLIFEDKIVVCFVSNIIIGPFLAENDYHDDGEKKEIQFSIFKSKFLVLQNQNLEFFQTPPTLYSFSTKIETVISKLILKLRQKCIFSQKTENFKKRIKFWNLKNENFAFSTTIDIIFVFY